VSVYFALEYAGVYYFWDDWTSFLPPDQGTFDYVSMDVPIGITYVEIVPRFIWPETGGFFDTVHLYGAMVNPDTGQIIGDPAADSFNFN
jgi:hypothetical protein